MTIEESRSLAVAINSLRFNPDLSDIEVQSHEMALANMRNRMQEGRGRCGQEENWLTPGRIEKLTRALDAAAKLLAGYGHCTHYPGYICDKGFTTPGVCEVCIKEHLLGREKAKEG